jgi:pimeloyl-ACP methyl ester carboxylesterase
MRSTFKAVVLVSVFACGACATMGDSTTTTGTTPVGTQHVTTSPPIPPPGRLIDLGGWRLHLLCTGEARTSQPTVIVEAGSGDFSVDWSLVQPGVARFARVCSYDRAGAGWSDLGPRPRTMHQIVWELRTLLQKAGERPPYVLVGHSSGGWLVRIFRSTYPSDVAGLVLCESGDERGLFTLKDDEKVPLVETANGRPSRRSRARTRYAIATSRPASAA